jgi:hypothetical protein
MTAGGVVGVFNPVERDERDYYRRLVALLSWHSWSVN